MLGNDVVDLTIDDKKHLNQRFINRTLTDNEQHQLLKSFDKNNYLWSLWAIKEASYKACQKLNHQLLFSPAQFELNQSCLKKLTNHDHNTAFFGTLQYRDTTLQLKLTWKQQATTKGQASHATAVHATAIKSKDPTALAAVQVLVSKMKGLSNYTNQSSEVRKLADTLLQTNEISANIQRPPLKVKDYTKAGPPILVTNNQTVLSHEISLSHDNDWLAVALLIK